MFIGREKELSLIEKRIASTRFEFGIIYGRRRIGKTTLLQEIVKKHHAIYYVANEMGLDYNLKQLGAIIAEYYQEPVSFSSFEQIFQYLAKRSEEKQIIFILDEFTYLMASSKEILSVFQNSVDQYLVNSNMKLILSGSHVGMVEDAISYKKPLYGRATFKLKLEPFDYFDAAKFYPNMSVTDKVRMYCIFGGVPFYASRIDDTKTVKENILDLIIEDGAIFEDEITFFLSQEVRSVATYGNIINAIASGATKLNEISTKSGVENSGTTSKHLELLQTLGIIEKEICFGESSHSRKTIYRVKDQLFNFHFRFIERNKTRKTIMDSETFYEMLIENELDKHVSLEFEIVCRDFLKRKFSKTIQEIGRYWYNDAKKREDIEIDVVMRNADDLVAFECKWKNAKIDRKVIVGLEAKAKHLGTTNIGCFSKSGYTEDFLDVITFEVTDLYNL